MSNERPIQISVDDAEHATIMAALRYWQESGMGEPSNRSDELHQIATNDAMVTSLDKAGIDQLCEHLNFDLRNVTAAEVQSYSKPMKKWTVEVNGYASCSVSAIAHVEADSPEAAQQIALDRAYDGDLDLEFSDPEPDRKSYTAEIPELVVEDDDTPEDSAGEIDDQVMHARL